jgi:hypothetical protein
MRSAQRGRQRATYRRRRWLALLTVLVGVMLGVAAQTGASLPFLMPSNENLARGGSPGGASEQPGLTADRPSVEGTVLSADRSSSEPQPEETTGEAGGEAAGDQDGAAPEEKEASEEPASDESLDVLVLGVDRRPGDTAGPTSHSDTMMLVRVSPHTGRVQSLSVPRDLLVEVEPGVEDRINTAYLYGGTEQAIAVVENLTGISPVDRYLPRSLRYRGLWGL